MVNPWFLDRGTLKIKFLSIMSPAGAGESGTAVETVIDSVDKLFRATERVPVVGGWREYLKPQLLLRIKTVNMVRSGNGIGD